MDIVIVVREKNKKLNDTKDINNVVCNVCPNYFVDRSINFQSLICNKNFPEYCSVLTFMIQKVIGKIQTITNK